jgi:hypothetical protein
VIVGGVMVIAGLLFILGGIGGVIWLVVRTFRNE